MTIHVNGSSSPIARGLPAPLRTARDCASLWTDNIDLDFDSAAERIIRAHANDGEHRDLPIADLKTWAIAGHEGNFAMVPLARHAELALCGYAVGGLLRGSQKVGWQRGERLTEPWAGFVPRVRE